jgi:hypothetical protein
MRNASLLLGELFASQEGLCAMELTFYLTFTLMRGDHFGRVVDAGGMIIFKCILQK